jgi:hypothetical protein
MDMLPWGFFYAANDKGGENYSQRSDTKPNEPLSIEDRSMRADSALSHLYDKEVCIAVLKDGSQHAVRWDREAWHFVLEETEPPTECPFDAIEEWRPASIKP